MELDRQRVEQKRKALTSNMRHSVRMKVRQVEATVAAAAAGGRYERSREVKVTAAACVHTFFVTK